MTRVCGLKVENLVSPLGIGTDHVRFSWRTVSSLEGFIQESYQIKLWEKDSCIWDSGEVFSPESLNICGGPRLKAQTRYTWQVTVKSKGISYQSDMAFFETGMLRKRWKGLWVAGIHNGNVKQPVNYLRKGFDVEKKIASARLYASALGVYECTINGRRISEDCMTPGWTDYFFRVQHQTYDVTAFLQQGRNALGVKLGEGWYCGSISRRRNSDQPSYGTHPVFIGELHITYTDGSKSIISSDKSWKCSIGGPVRFSDIYDGEKYDANYDMGSWDKPEYDDRGWSCCLEKNRRVSIVGADAPPVRCMEELNAVQVTELDPALWEREPNIPDPKRLTLIDFGQNTVGRIKLRIKLEKGKKITIRHGEILKDDGSLFLHNLRSARAAVELIGNGETFEYEPLFTFFGFRYLQITDLPEECKPEEIVVKVMYSSMERTGDFKCSDKLINRLYMNQLWSNKSNYLDIPTDCPQRDERLGWLADAWIFADTASYNFDVSAFFRKYIADVNLSRTSYGEYPQYAPFFAVNHLDAEWFGTEYYKGHNAWAEAAIICPYLMYLKYNDKKILSDHYENMKHWILFQEENSEDHIRCSCAWRDWLNHKDPTSESLISTAFFAYGTSLMIKISAILGKEEDRAEFTRIHERIVRAYNDKFIVNGSLVEKSQSAALLTLAFKLCPENMERSILDQLISNIERNGDRLSTGFLGTAFLLPVLFQYGKTQIAEKLLFQKEFPSWLYPVLQGATTIWERWDGYTIENGILKQPMNSFNHYAYGAVAACFYAHLGGIKQDLSAVGFRKVIIEPYFSGNLEFVEASYNSPYGMIKTSWKRKNSKIIFNAEIPANVIAAFHLPGTEEKIIGSGKYTFTITEEY